MARAFIGLGANLGDRAATIQAAVAAMGALPETTVARVSALIETDPVGGPSGQPAFLNGVAELQTELAPHDLLQHLLAIEERLGRVREVKWGPRVIDLDLLLYDDAIIEEPDLTVPHPLLHERRFVLEPLADLAPDVVHPRLGNTVSEMLADLG